MLNKQSGWALWYITESENELSEISNETVDVSLISSTKRLEWLAGRSLIKALVENCGLDFYGIEKDEFGKPFLKHNSHYISLSHSYPYVAAQIDPVRAVGIDLEQPKSKLLNIAHRVLSPVELNDAGSDVVKHCIYWCGKEAMYKSYGKRGLSFANHLLIEPFDRMRTGDLRGKIIANGNSRELTLAYSVQTDYVLVFTTPG